MSSPHGVAFGVDRMGEPVEFDPCSAHTVLSGATRGGKSATAYSIFAQIADDPCVAVVGVDPSSILLTPFERAGGGVVTGSSPAALDRAVEMFQGVEKEMDERNRRLSLRGLDKVPADWISPRLPAIVLVLEEYAGTLSATNKDQRAEVVRIVGRVLREGAKSSIHACTVIQRPEAAVLHDRAQYARRISHRLDNGDSVRMLFEKATPDEVARIMDLRPGEGIIHDAGSPYRVFKSRYLEYPAYVAHVRAALRDRPPVSVLIGGTL